MKNFPILCPEEGCIHEISINDIQDYINPALKEKYFEFSFHMFVEKNSRNTHWCKTPGCNAIYQIEDKGCQTYKCPSCKKAYCLNCRLEEHKGLTCEMNREIASYSDEDKKFLGYVKGWNFKRCPSCRFWVQRI